MFTPCPTCGRLLHPVSNGKLPRHRTPSRKPSRRGTVYVSGFAALTGRDAPWCPGGDNG